MCGRERQRDGTRGGEGGARKVLGKLEMPRRRALSTGLVFSFEALPCRIRRFGTNLGFRAKFVERQISGGLGGELWTIRSSIWDAMMASF
ncbi:hypothetical protein NL676_004819 [Syzygium grande]|nr:hypothetical protein NL676_004819 [Syzygium grande]